MADVQAEHGFTKVANELLEIVMQQKFNGTQFKIIMAVWRYTYGFQRKEHDMSLTFLSTATGVHKQQVKTELGKLIERNVIKVTSDPSYTTSRKISFNKNYDEWIDLQSVKTVPVSESTYTTVSENTYSPVSESTYTTVSESTYQERNIKENNKEKFKENSSSIETVISFWDENGFGYNNINAKNELLAYLDDGYSGEMVIEALKIACNKNARHIKFVKGVFRNWIDAGIKTIEQVKGLEQKFNAKQSIFTQGEESKNRQTNSKPLTDEELERMKKWEEELPY